MGKGRFVTNADLWKQLDELLCSRPEANFLITKVKGHATAEDVVAGRTTDMNKFGNDAADELAVA
eukprot:11499771-Karenia_brevis.AAC.1